MTRYIAGYNGAKFIDVTKAVDLKQDEDGKVYLVDKDGKTVGTGINIQTAEKRTLTIYDDETGETTTITKSDDNFTIYDDETDSTMSKIGGFTYEEVDE